MVPAMLFRACLPLLALAAIQASAEIPDRPEKLRFPALAYEPPDPAQYRVPLKSGPVAYVVPDHELPLVTVQVLVRTGSYLDPVGREGLAATVGALLVRGGAGSKSAEELEERLAFLAAQLGASVGGDSGTVSLNLLSKDLEEGLQLLKDVLSRPRFQADKLELQRQQSLQEMKQRNDDSADIEARELAALSQGPKFWTSRLPTGASVTALTRDELSAFHRKWFHPGNFTVAVSGDFERDDMVRRLETLFADWPYPGEKPPPVPTNLSPAAPGVYIVDKDVPQGRVSVVLPGVLRDDPDYPAIQVMNDILGGGGFTARIMSRVRDDEGLAYAAGSSFPGGTWFPSTFRAAFQSKSRTVTYASSIVLEEMRRITEKPVSEEELKTAKRSFIDTFPENFNTKGKVAGIFARDEYTGRFEKQPGFWKSYRQRLESVSAADVQRVATQHLHADRVAILVVGKKEEILKPHPDHPVKFEQLSAGGMRDLPLRDPLTLEPLPSKTSEAAR
jgi:zinc protease